MNGGTHQSVMMESNNLNGSQRRRSPRLSSPPPQASIKSDNKMALGCVAVKRSITVRKIAPRKTVAPSEQDKENTPRRSGSEDVQPKKQKVSTPTPAPAPDRRSSSAAQTKTAPRKTAAPSEHNKVNTPRQSGSEDVQKKQKVSTPTAASDRRGSSSGKKKKKATMPSPILPSSPPPSTQPVEDPEDKLWSQKVRRSYTRLSNNSLNSPNSRETLFGFDKLKTPEVVRGSKTALEVSGSLSGLNSFTSLLEADDCGSGFPEPDLNIPGVAVVKEKRRRKKVQQIDSTELDSLAAKMNAEFEEAEGFELVVE